MASEIYKEIKKRAYERQLQRIDVRKTIKTEENL